MNNNCGQFSFQTLATTRNVLFYTLTLRRKCETVHGMTEDSVGTDQTVDTDMSVKFSAWTISPVSALPDLTVQMLTPDLNFQFRPNSTREPGKKWFWHVTFVANPDTNFRNALSFRMTWKINSRCQVCWRLRSRCNVTFLKKAYQFYLKNYPVDLNEISEVVVTYP